MKNNIFLTGMAKFSGLVGTYETNLSLTNCNVTESLFFTSLTFASIISISTSQLKIWNCTIRILHTNTSTQSVGLVNYANVLQISQLVLTSYRKETTGSLIANTVANSTSITLTQININETVGGTYAPIMLLSGTNVITYTNITGVVNGTTYAQGLFYTAGQNLVASLVLNYSTINMVLNAANSSMVGGIIYNSLINISSTVINGSITGSNSSKLFYNKNYVQTGQNYNNMSVCVTGPTVFCVLGACSTSGYTSCN